MSLHRRLERLEQQAERPAEDLQRWAQREFLSRLSAEELDWLTEPADEAAYLVPCPHVELVECGCMAEGRTSRGFEANPELHEEHARRWRVLYERRQEILLREPRGN